MLSEPCCRRNLLRDNAVTCPTGLSPMGTADRFLEFMETKLVPFMAARYGASDTRLFAGNSRGGLLVMYSLIQKPDLFAGRICFSTPFWRENNLLVERVSALLGQKTAMRSFLYVSACANETDNIQSGLDAMVAVFQNRAPAGFVWYIERTPEVDTACYVGSKCRLTSCWSCRTGRRAELFREDPAA